MLERSLSNLSDPSVYMCLTKELTAMQLLSSLIIRQVTLWYASRKYIASGVILSKANNLFSPYFFFS
jgi:hypothetical protein